MRKRFGYAAALPSNVSDNIVIAWVAAVLMEVPIIRADMDFDIASNSAMSITNFQNRMLEVGAGFEVPFAWMYHIDLSSIASA